MALYGYNYDSAYASSESSIEDSEGLPTESFASGEVAYKLGEKFGQTIGTEKTPVLGGKKVYTAINCAGKNYYSNSVISDISEHSYDNGFCKNCGECQAATKNSNGDYEITNAGQLYWFADKVNNDNDNYANANAVLTKNIVINKNVLNADGTLNTTNSSTFRKWTPIGICYTDSDTEAYILNTYGGTFDGKGYTISGLYYDNSIYDDVGLFGYLDKATIKNLGVIDSYFGVTDSWDVGGICGLGKDSTIEKCYTKVTIAVTTDNTEINCLYVGGLCGTIQGGNTNTKVNDCYSMANITVNDSRIFDEYDTSYAGGTVDYAPCIGGVVGYSSSGAISNSYFVGTLSLTGNNGEHTGGVCGTAFYGSVKNCYYDSTLYTGESIGKKELSDSDIQNVEGKTTSQFKTGEVAYLLDTKIRATDSDLVWSQTLGTDTYPVFGDNHVYADTDSNGNSYYYNLSESDIAKVVGYTLTLDGTIGVNFYMVVDESYTTDGTYAEIKCKNKTQKVYLKDVEKIDGTNIYIFPCEVAAPDMTQSVTIQLKNDSNTKNSDTFTFTVQEYAKYILENPDDFASYGDELIPLIKAMLNYGATAQKYFDVNTSNLANSILSDSDKAIQEVTVSDFEDYKSDIKNNESVGNFVSFHLNLNSVTSIRENFIPAENATDLKFYIGETQLDNDNTKDMYYYKSGEKYVLVMSNINALDLDTAYEFKVSCTVDNDEITSTAKVSTFSYIYAALSQTDEKYDFLKETMKALYGFNQKAEAYSTAQNA